MIQLCDPLPTTQTLEKYELDLGYVPLTDCAPLVIAHEKGFFERHGLRVTLHREQAWASIRDKVALGILDGAQMLGPMPLAMTLGLGMPAVPTVTGLCLSLSGNAITVSNALFEEMKQQDPIAMASRPVSANALSQVIQNRETRGASKLTLGVVFPASTHDLELRYWMGAAGIDPDVDVRIMVIPPPSMPFALRDGEIDGYCVGEPWNSLAVQRGYGRTLITKYELCNNAVEKVLGVTREWADAHPQTHLAMIRALIEAAEWIDQDENRDEVARILVGGYVDAPLEVVAMPLGGNFQYEQDGPVVSIPDFNVFHRYAANFPWRSSGRWFLSQMRRWDQWTGKEDLGSIAKSVFLTDVYRAAAAGIGRPAPLIDHKPAQAHAAPWLLTDATAPISMGPDLLLCEGSGLRPLASPSTHPSQPPC